MKIRMPEITLEEQLKKMRDRQIAWVPTFAPVQLHATGDMTVKTVNMAMELEGLSFALTNRA